LEQIARGKLTQLTDFIFVTGFASDHIVNDGGAVGT
jgi:hypothetical protein